MTDAPRERFLRNHQENVRCMRAAAIRAYRDGHLTAYERITKIADAWDGLAEQAACDGESDD